MDVLMLQTYQVKYRILFMLIGTIMCFTASAQKEEVLFSINGNDVSLDEFRYIYEKNNREKADYSSESLNEYLDLYINFKLKVQKARDLGYDQSENYQLELAGYRSQLADSYIIDKEVIPRMVDDIYKRGKEDLKVNHVLLSLSRNASSDEESKAYEKAQLVIKELGRGMPFHQAVVQFSQDRNSVKFGGDIGYINAPLPDGFVELENEAYKLEVGQYSQPVRTDLGLHILELVNRRPARGKMKASHLLIRNSKNGIKLADAYPRVKRIYDDITNGTISFDEATIKFSEDRETKGQVGDLGTFGIGQYEESFESGAFSLEKDGDVSVPIETSIGWHLIRRESKLDPDTKDIILERIKSNPRQGERFEIAKSIVVDEIKERAKFKENEVLLYTFISSLDENFYTYDWAPSKFGEQKFISFDSEFYDLNDFAEYSRKNAKIRMSAKGQQTIEETVKDIYRAYVHEKAISYAEDRLEESYPDFKNLMREYREGILLFDITKDFVWDKASKDTLGIKQYFEANRNDYNWNERVKITNYSLRTLEPGVVTNIINSSRKLRSSDLTREYNTERELILYRPETLDANDPSLKGMEIEEGFVTSPEFHTNLNVSTFRKIEEVIPARPKSLKEARGYVISDYQDELDKKWITTLRKEYKIKVNKKTFRKIVN